MFKPYKYIKGPPKLEEKKHDVRRPSFKTPSIPFRHLFSVVLIISGLCLLGGQLVFPLLIATGKTKQPLLKPIPGSTLGAAQPNEPFFVFSELARDGSPEQTESSSEDTPAIFYISIPKLGIERAEVDTNSQSLSPDERLGHYAGAALPGRVGNTFIYGHSVLPIFYDPKNYKTIFSTLGDLEEGDEVVVEFGEEVYTYVVEKQQVLETEDVNPLDPISPRFLNQAYLTLMTCWPPGLKTKRLLVQARLVL